MWLYFYSVLFIKIGGSLDLVRWLKFVDFVIVMDCFEVFYVKMKFFIRLYCLVFFCSIMIYIFLFYGFWKGRGDRRVGGC